MNLKRLGGALFSAAFLASVGVVAIAPQASAETLGGEGTAASTVSDAGLSGIASPRATLNAQNTPQTQTLCVPSGCSLTVPVIGAAVEGGAIPATVRGNPNVSVPIQAWAVKFETRNNVSVVTHAAKISNSVVARTDQYGEAQITLTATTPPAGSSGWNVMLQTQDFAVGKALIGDGVDSVDVFQVYTSRGVDMGFAETQFGSDGIFHREVRVGVPGHKYSVEMLSGGKWINIDNAGPATVAKYGTASIQARVPKNTPTGKYRTRLVNVTKGLKDISPDAPYTYFTWTYNKPPAVTDPHFNVYTTPGTWDYNGRKWKTSCEPYSTTERCRTEIWATQITYNAGRFTRTDGYVFNNLTYKPSPRSIWSKNPLGGGAKVGYNSQWKAADGRLWRTECDTATSGRNGCRSYIWATVAEPYGSSYRVVNKWLFNNIVQFS